MKRTDADEGNPARMTCKRLASQVEDLASRINDLSIRTRKFGAFTDDRRIDQLHSALYRLACEAADLATAILVGKVPLSPEYRDEGAGRARPLLDAIEVKALPIAPETAPAMPAKAPEPDAPAPEPWQLEPLARLRANQRVLKKIEKNTDVRTLGQLDALVKTLADQDRFADRNGITKHEAQILFDHLNRHITAARALKRVLERDANKAQYRVEQGPGEPDDAATADKEDVA